jgi:hypothetical protein
MRLARTLLLAVFTIALSALGIFAGCAGGSAATTTSGSTIVANLQPYTDPTGTIATYTTAGDIDESTPFFQSLGTNTRTCATCHQLDQGMSISAASAAALFTSSNGTDPLFDSIDGANCPTVAVGNLAGHSLMVNNGLVRIPVTLPTTTQFTITVLNDPYGCATTLSATGQQIVSVYRRPLASASLPFLSNIMWDTRFTTAALTSSSNFSANLSTDLTTQLLAAIATHEQGTATPTATQISGILALEQGLFTAQATDNAAGSLSANGATGGPANLAALDYYPGINDSLGNDPTGAKFNPSSMTLYTAWANSSNSQQASIARGEAIFNTAPMTITNVSGLTNQTGVPATVKGSCSFCHDTPNVGDRSLPLPMDTGVMHVASAETDQNIVNGLNQLSTPGLPTYQITGCKVNGAAVTYTTTDPGLALTTGLCADVNHLKVPVLRGLAARAPYFHNGSASSLADLVNFYNARFQMGLNAGQKTDLVNFLNAL